MMTSRNFNPLTTPQSSSPLGVGARMRPPGMPRMKSMTKRGKGVPSLGGLQLLKMASGGYIDEPSMGQISVHNALRGTPGLSLFEYLSQRMADGGEPYRLPPGGISAARREARTRARYEPRITGESELAPDEESYRDFGLDSPLRAARFQWRPRRGPSMIDRQRDAMFDIANAPVVAKQQAYEDWRQGGVGDLAVELATDPLNWFGPTSFFKAIRGLKPNIAMMGMYSQMPPSLREAGTMGEGRAPFMEDVWRVPRDFRMIGN